jgi:hypothetical protein
MDSRQDAEHARTDAADVTRRRMLAAGGLAATGLALTGSTAMGAGRRAAAAPAQQTAATLVGVLAAGGGKLTGHGFLTEVYGLGSLGPAGLSDIPSRLGFKLSAKLLGNAASAGVVIARSEGTLTIVEPDAKANLEDAKSFKGGRTVARATARLQSVIARGEGMATVTGDVIQRGSGRTRIGAAGGQPFGMDGLTLRLWGTGPVVLTLADEASWTHQVAGNLVVSGT